MNKTILTTTLALGLGAALTGNAAHAAGQTVDQAQQPVNKAELAELAMHHHAQLNQAPVQEGAYDYEFDYNSYHFDFESNGTSWTWEYHTIGSAPVTVSQPVQAVAAPMPVQAPTYQAPVQKAAVQAPAYQAPVQKAAVQQTAAPVQQSTSNVQVNAHLQLIAQRESGGNIHAINPTSGAAGKYQFLQSTWDAVAPAQWKGVSPANAPESVQDAAAVKLYNEYGPSQWVTA